MMDGLLCSYRYSVVMLLVLNKSELLEVLLVYLLFFFFFQAEDGIRDLIVTGVQTCALPILDIVREHPAGNVLIVSHKATIRLLLSSLLGFDPRRYRDTLDQNPAALNIVEIGRASCRERV